MTDTKMLRYLAAALVLANGAVHLHQRFTAPEIELGAGPTIQRLFLLNVAASVVIAALLVGRDHLIVDLGALGFSLGTIGAFLITRYGELFGYQETMWRTPTIVAAAVEITAAVVLAVLVVRKVEALRGAPQPLPR